MAELADSIRRQLAEADAGELTLTQTMRARWEGALTILELVLGDPPSTVPRDFLDGLL